MKIGEEEKQGHIQKNENLISKKRKKEIQSFFFLRI
jgi:hypothetical protein